MHQYFSILFLQSFNLPSEPLPLPQIGNNKNVPSSGNGNEGKRTGNIDHVYTSKSHLSNITNNLNLNRQIDQSQLQRSSSAGSGGRGGKQGARLPGGIILPPTWPISNMRNDLFEAPTKIANGENSVENVLGRFEHADRLPNCLGVDYEPPSPSGLIQIPQLLNLSMPKPPPGPQQNITVCHAYLVWGKDPGR